MKTGNLYCDALGIAVPSVEKAAQSRDACSYSLLIAVLLERGGPVTLEEAARRIAAAGIGDEGSVVDSLWVCPQRPRQRPSVTQANTLFHGIPSLSVEPFALSAEVGREQATSRGNSGG